MSDDFFLFVFYVSFFWNDTNLNEHGDQQPATRDNMMDFFVLLNLNKNGNKYIIVW